MRLILHRSVRARPTLIGKGVIPVIKTLFVGIDVSSSSCEVVLLDDDGTQLGRSFSVPNNLEGASKLAEMICT